MAPPWAPSFRHRTLGLLAGCARAKLGSALQQMLSFLRLALRHFLRRHDPDQQARGNPWLPRGPPPSDIARSDSLQAALEQSSAPPSSRCSRSYVWHFVTSFAGMTRISKHGGTHGSPVGPLLHTSHARTPCRLRSSKARLRPPADALVPTFGTSSLPSPA